VDFVVVGRTVSMQAEFRQDTEAWYSLMQAAMSVSHFLIFFVMFCQHLGRVVVLLVAKNVCLLILLELAFCISRDN